MYTVPSSFHMKYFHPLIKLSQHFLPKTNTELILRITGHCHSFFLDIFWVVETTLKISILSRNRNCLFVQVSMNHMKPDKAHCADSQETRKVVFLYLQQWPSIPDGKSKGKSQSTTRNYLFCCSIRLDHQQAQFRVY